jgi:hypothetical protein
MKLLIFDLSIYMRLDQFYIQGLTDPKTISNLSRFTLHVLMASIGFIVKKKDNLFL